MSSYTVLKHQNGQVTWYSRNIRWIGNAVATMNRATFQHPKAFFELKEVG